MDDGASTVEGGGAVGKPNQNQNSPGPKLPPTATPESRRALQAQGGITPWVCDLCNIVFGSAQALGGHRSNSAEHQERVQKLRQQGLAAIIKPDGKGKPSWGIATSVPAPYHVGCRVEVLYDDGVWYGGVLESSPEMRDGAKKFRISFDDGDEIWTSLPAKDVRPAASDLATAGRIPREGIPVQVSGENTLGAPVTKDGILMQDGERLYINYGKKVISMKTFCKFVGEMDREPKDVIMVTEKNVTLANYFESLGIQTPAAKPPLHSTHISPKEGKDVEKGEENSRESQEKGEISGRNTWVRRVHDGRSRWISSINISSRRYMSNRRPESHGGFKKFSPNHFMGGVTKRSTHIKPYLEAYNRYTTAERRRLRGDLNNPIMTDREAFSMAVAKWRTLSDDDKEAWRVKSRAGRKGGTGPKKSEHVNQGPFKKSSNTDIDLPISSGDEPLAVEEGHDENEEGINNDDADSGDEDEDSDALGGGPVHSVSDVDDFLDGLEVGHKLLVQDCTDLQWYKGRVTESVQGQVKVHFVGWSSIWDEWIETDSPRLKPWPGGRVRLKEGWPQDGGMGSTVAFESSRAKESWMCTADMRGFEQGFRYNGQRVRIRDRKYGVLHGAIQDFDAVQGYLIRIEEHKEDRWMPLPDADVDFVQRVNSGIATVSHVKVPDERKGVGGRPGVAGGLRGYHCKKCDRYFSSKSALHIHIGKSLQCKKALWGPGGKFAMHAHVRAERSYQENEFEHEDEDMMDMDGQEPLEYEHAMHGASRSGSCDGDIGALKGVNTHSAAAAMIAEILGHPQEALEAARERRGMFYFPPPRRERVVEKSSGTQGQGGIKNRGTIAAKEGASQHTSTPRGLYAPEPLRGTKARQALAIFFEKDALQPSLTRAVQRRMSRISTPV